MAGLVKTFETARLPDAFLRSAKDDLLLGALEVFGDGPLLDG